MLCALPDHRPGKWESERRGLKDKEAERKKRVCVCVFVDVCVCWERQHRVELCAYFWWAVQPSASNFFFFFILSIAAVPDDGQDDVEPRFFELAAAQCFQHKPKGVFIPATPGSTESRPSFKTLLTTHTHAHTALMLRQILPSTLPVFVILIHVTKPTSGTDFDHISFVFFHFSVPVRLLEFVQRANSVSRHYHL